ncbi:MAG TPA: polyprenyl synthetase family protein [Clostridiaceae bacterium]|nr:polyprenyl synthetase family protein [Clostridiaceae bacterium]
MSDLNFEDLLTQRRQVVESWLENSLPDLPLSEGGAAVRAARYSLLGGGKRIRPVMLAETAVLYGVEEAVFRPYAVAIEMIHTYSLIHDDLPAMDNDDLRRGQPSCHKKYDEATAILAGDLLLNAAFETMLRALSKSPSTNLNSQIRAALSLAEAAGCTGMIAGQCLDLFFEQKVATKAQLTGLQEKKTGALLVAALRAGAYLGAAASDELELWRKLGLLLGLIFQMTDDLLDVIAEESVLGKSIGKDACAGKSTFVTVYGVDKTKIMIKEKEEEASEILKLMNGRGLDMSFFVGLNKYLPNRIN